MGSRVASRWSGRLSATLCCGRTCLRCRGSTPTLATPPTPAPGPPDLPGAPARTFSLPRARARRAYFDSPQRGYSVPRESVLEQNRLDVISLVHLHSLLMRRLQGAEAGMDADDWLALGRHRFRRGARADGWRALRNAAGFSSGEAAATAGLWISKRLVRRRSIDAADRILEQLESTFSEDVRVALARARLLEWRRRDPHRALTVVEAAQARFPESAAELGVRRDRLRRKVLRRGPEGGRRERHRRKRGLPGRPGYDGGGDLEGGGGAPGARARPDPVGPREPGPTLA